jgi:intracellular septation protein A
LRAFVIIFGIILAASGGVLAYRSFFIAPHTAVVITETSVREVPNMMRVAGGLVLLVGGASIALFAALRRR